MKYYTSTTEFNCGIDLHARQMYVCVMDRQGKKLVHTNVKVIRPLNDPCVRCCASGSATSGVAPNCWPAFTASN